MINVAVLGYGTVGSGVVEVIEENKETVNKKSAAELNVKYILDLRDFPGDPYENKVIHDFNIILNDPEVSIVCETMGGVGAAYKFTKECLLAGKSVCTSNKELVAKHGPELLQIAKDKQCNYLFEASVGGGIPVIRPINYSLTAEEIENITGILNGTTNYMLTKMDALGADFDEVLKEAQANGYAEADPTADIEGYDARRKIAILSSLMMTKNVDSEKVYTEGITKITSADFEYAKAAGFKIKLLGTSEKVSDSEVAVMVAPFFIDLDHPLAMVNDVFNAVFVKGNMLGDSMYYGRGAGKLPTASAVVSDVIDCARHLGKTVMCFWDAEDVKLADVRELEREFFVRIDASAKDDLEELFEDFEEIIADRKEDAGYFLPPTKEREVYEKLEKLGDKVLNVIRIYR
ncbi:MAG: homoserine dehydrogenase [Acetatifactor sp.]|nr:homoserine dehydrogenase [Acetatifactor sp.]